MGTRVLIGNSIPPGVGQLRVHKELKLGDIVLTMVPRKKQDALAVAKYCRENQIYLCFSEFLWRGEETLGWPWRQHVSRRQFYSREDVDEIVDAAGEYYFGRIAIGEIGGVLYWPKAYTIGRGEKNWESLPPADTVEQAKKTYVDYVRRWLDFERDEIGKGPLMNVDSSLVQKYLHEAGIDIFCLEVMPGDPQLMHAATRGAARAWDKPWGAHIAMQCYGGVRFDELWNKRWRTAFLYSHLAGAEFIYPESGHYGYGPVGANKAYNFASKEMKRVRGVIRETYQFARIHQRPDNGPRVGVGVVYGNLDGAPGCWNRYAWGQYSDDKWLEGPPERGWRFVDGFHRKQEWARETVQGETDFSGNPPFGQYDLVPIEASVDVLKRYPCLVFLAWNTMTPAIYGKLKEYVRDGGHLVMSLAHLSTHTDRAADLKLYRNGDYHDLFGVKIVGREDRDVRGIKCMADSSLPGYQFPRWRIGTDPRFLGRIAPAKVEVSTARVISGWSDTYHISEEDLAARPILVENTLGKGKAFLTTVWQYPADEGIRPFTEDVLRTVLAGEQGEIRLLSSDRVRYAVYDGKLPGSSKPYNVVYLLNTDPDCAYQARLWVRGRTTAPFDLPANELRLAYVCRDAVLVPESKCVDVKSWKPSKTGHQVRLYSAAEQNIEIHNVGRSKLKVFLNGKAAACEPGTAAVVALARAADPDRKEFFAADFLEEPAVKHRGAGLPY